jgi:hypothetical protein
MTEVWDEIGFVISSRYRVAVLERLAEGPATPSQIATDSELSIDRKKGRVYGITDRGEKIWNQIQSENMLEE